MKHILATIFVLLIFSSVSFSQSLGFHGVAGHVALLLPQEDGLETGFGFGAVVNMGEITDGLGLFPKLYYQLPGVEDVSGVDVTFSALVIGADVHYGVNENVYVGGGLALYSKSSEAEFTNPFTGQKQTIDDSESDIGITLLGGYNLNLGTMPAAIEASYNIVDHYNHLEIAFNVFFGGN